MIQDILGDAGWPAAIVAVVILLVWGFNVHEDRDDRQEVRLEIIEQCGHEETKDAVERCVDRIEAAL